MVAFIHAQRVYTWQVYPYTWQDYPYTHGRFIYRAGYITCFFFFSCRQELAQQVHLSCLQGEAIQTLLKEVSISQPLYCSAA